MVTEKDAARLNPDADVWALRMDLQTTGAEAPHRRHCRASRMITVLGWLWWWVLPVRKQVAIANPPSLPRPDPTELRQDRRRDDLVLRRAGLRKARDRSRCRADA